MNVAKYAPSGFYIASADKSGKVSNPTSTALSTSDLHVLNSSWMTQVRIWDTVNTEHILKSEYQPISGPIYDLVKTRCSVAIKSCSKWLLAFSYFPIPDYEISLPSLRPGLLTTKELWLSARVGRSSAMSSWRTQELATATSLARRDPSIAVISDQRGPSGTLNLTNCGLVFVGNNNGSLIFFRIITGSEDNSVAHYEGPPFKFKGVKSVSTT